MSALFYLVPYRFQRYASLPMEALVLPCRTHPRFTRTTDYFAIGSFDDLIIQQAEDTNIKSVANGIKYVVNGNSSDIWIFRPKICLNKKAPIVQPGEFELIQ